MKIVIRPADLEADRELLIDTLFRYLTPNSNSRRFDWLYRKNPHGEARVWVAFDTDNRATVGMAAAFPRRMYVQGRLELGWVLGDFCLNHQYRSLGPALQLYRAYLAEVDSASMAFCYDFPSKRMMAICNRLGIHPFSQMIRLAKLLRVDQKIGKMIKNPLVARGLSRTGNLLLMSSRRPKKSRALMVSLHQGDCEEEFSRLGQKIGGQYGLCIQRSAEYLNWRFLANPLSSYELLTARRDSALLGYAVFSHCGEDATLVDLFGIEEPAIINALVHQVLALLHERGVATVSAPILESHPWVPLLQRLGFRTREACPVVIYAPSHTPLNHSMFEGFNWFLMHGDRDS